jgi:GNAT superfamily N-acetyltransferase
MTSPDGLSIRLATAGDGDCLPVLLEQLGYPTSADEARRRLERQLDATEAEVLVAEADGEIVGLASFYFLELLYRARPQCRITALVVRSDHRRRGTGRALMRAIERAARERGCFRLELTTRPDRPGALPFYRALGFTERPRRLVKALDPE